MPCLFSMFYMMQYKHRTVSWWYLESIYTFFKSNTTRRKYIQILWCWISYAGKRFIFNVTFCNNGVKHFMNIQCGWNWTENYLHLFSKLLSLRISLILLIGVSRFQFHTLFCAFCCVEYNVAIVELHFHEFCMIRNCDVENDYLKGISISFCSNESAVKRFCEYCSMNTRSFKVCFTRYLIRLKLSYSKLKMQITFL